MTTVQPADLALIEEFEGFSSVVYACPAGVPTIGFGTTRYPDGRRVAFGDAPCTREQARGWIAYECRHVAQIIDRIIVVDLSENERAALISFSFNLGTGALAASTLRRKLNRRDQAGAAAEFPRWRFSGGRVLKGLVRRRAAERRLFERGAAPA